MCGIIGFIGREGGEHAQEFVMNQYEDQQSRGGKGFGVITADKDNVTVRRSTGETKALIDVARTVDPVIIFHHRYPTSTENKRDQTHPMEVSHDELKYDYLIVHNGVINNSHELFKRHTEELGYVYKTYTAPESKYNGYGYASSGYYSRFNDSESLAIEIARFLEGKEKVIGTSGSAAFLGIKLKKGTKRAVSIFWGSNGGNPLDFMETEHGILLASELGSDAYATSKNEFYELKFKDIFNPKKAKEKLLDIADMSTLEFKPPETTTHHSYLKTDTKTDRIPPKTDEKPGEKVGTKPEKNSIDELENQYISKVLPDGFTQTEWAVRKVTYRKMREVNQAILDFGDYLASYVQNPLPDDAPQDQRSMEYTPEDMIDDTMTMIEQSLNDIVHRTYQLAEYTLPDDEEDDGPPTQHPTYLDDKKKTLPALPAKTYGPLNQSDVSRDDFTLFPY